MIFIYSSIIHESNANKFRRRHGRSVQRVGGQRRIRGRQEKPRARSRGRRQEPRSRGSGRSRGNCSAPGHIPVGRPKPRALGLRRPVGLRKPARKAAGAAEGGRSRGRRQEPRKAEGATINCSAPGLDQWADLSLEHLAREGLLA